MAKVTVFGFGFIKGLFYPVTADVFCISVLYSVKTGFAELERLVAETSEQHACLEMRKRFAAYSKGISGGAALRARIVHAATVQDYKDIFSQFIC